MLGEIILLALFNQRMNGCSTQSKMSQATNPPVNAGKRLLPVLIDEIAASDPERVFASMPQTNDPSAGFRDVTFVHLSKAIDRCSWWVKEQLGCSNSFETVAYIGPLDLLYHILALACVKTGHKVSGPGSPGIIG